MDHLHSTPLHLPDTLRRLLTPTLSTLPFEQSTLERFVHSPCRRVRQAICHHLYNYETSINSLVSRDTLCRKQKVIRLMMAQNAACQAMLLQMHCYLLAFMQTIFMTLIIILALPCVFSEKQQTAGSDGCNDNHHDNTEN